MQELMIWNGINVEINWKKVLFLEFVTEYDIVVH